MNIALTPAPGKPKIARPAITACSNDNKILQTEGDKGH